MDRFPSGATGHSAIVRIRLVVDGRSFDVGQVGGGRLIFPEPIRLPGGPEGARGEVLLSIDGAERRWAVDLKPESEPSRSVEAVFREPAKTGNGGGIQR